MLAAELLLFEWKPRSLIPVALASATAAVAAFSDDSLRVVVYRMAETGLTRLPVVDRNDERHAIGTVSLTDLLQARTRDLEEERRRERLLHLRLPFGLNPRDTISSRR